MAKALRSLDCITKTNFKRSFAGAWGYFDREGKRWAIQRLDAVSWRTLFLSSFLFFSYSPCYCFLSHFTLFIFSLIFLYLFFLFDKVRGWKVCTELCKNYVKIDPGISPHCINFHTFAHKPGSVKFLAWVRALWWIANAMRIFRINVPQILKSDFIHLQSRHSGTGMIISHHHKGPTWLSRTLLRPCC